MVCFDGFRLSHTMMPVTIPSQEEVDAFLPPFGCRIAWMRKSRSTSIRW